MWAWRVQLGARLAPAANTGSKEQAWHSQLGVLERAGGWGFPCFLVAAGKHWVAWWQQGIWSTLWEGGRLLLAGVAVKVFRLLERCGPREDVQCSRPDRQARRSQLCLCGRSIAQQTSERNSNGPNASERVRRYFQDSYTVAAAEILDKCCGS